MSIAVFSRAVEYAREVISGLGNDDLRLSTPCADWNVGQVVLHLADVADALIDLVDTGHLCLPDTPRIDDPDPVSTLLASMDKLSTRLSTTSEAERADAATRAGAIEFTMHSWDIGVAQNRDHMTPADLAHDVRELVSSLLTDDTRGMNFAPDVNLFHDAPPDDRLAAFLGRRRPASPSLTALRAGF